MVGSETRHISLLSIYLYVCVVSEQKPPFETILHVRGFGIRFDTLTVQQC